MNRKRSRRSAPENNPAQESAGYEELPRVMGSQEGDQGFASLSGEHAGQTAQNAGQAIREQTSTLAAGIGENFTKSMEDQKRRGLDAVRSFAGAVDTAGRELEQQSPQVARYVRDAAESLQSFTRNIEGRGLNDLMRSATDLARSRPTLFMVGAVAAGFALARFMKSSPASHRTDARDDYRSEAGFSDAGLAREETETAYGN